MTGAQHFRVARPSDDLDALVAFYRDALGFEAIGSFEDHAGFDGVMLGHPALPYHLEFTRERGARAGRAPSAEHLLVFYLDGDAAWNEALARLERAGVAPVRAHNPYWDDHGVTVEDPDGYRIVLHRGPWRP
jgi:catechol 2,3-dioxygenase-like lactoylglutathione lyase family enzyme